MMPQAGQGFRWVDAAAGPALVCEPLDSVAPHLFTTRAWELGSTIDGDRTSGWWQVAAGIGVNAAHLVRARQVHGASVVVRQRLRPRRAEDMQIRGGASEKHRGDPRATRRPEADILITDDQDLAVTVQTADCVPLLIADPRTGAVAAAHAGWRGLAAGVPATAILALAQEFGVAPHDVLAAIGPSIGACCYEVGDDMRQRFIDRGSSAGQIDRWFSRTPPRWPRNPAMAGVEGSGRTGHWFFDAWTATRDQLVEAGVLESRTYVAELCTASHLETFCSYRRDGSVAGRMAGVIRRMG